MEHRHAKIGRVKTGRIALGASLGLGMMAGLAGCESAARQDSLLVRPSTDDIAFAGVPIFRDRPLSETLEGSLELADYTVALRQAGLFDTLRQAGPFTVFAVPNEALEAEQQAAYGQLLSPENGAGLKRLVAYTIVPGRYTEARLRDMIARSHGAVGLVTLGGHDVLTVSTEPGTGALLLSDPQGRINHLWLADVPQSNGVLYAPNRCWRRCTAASRPPSAHPRRNVDCYAIIDFNARGV